MRCYGELKFQNGAYCLCLPHPCVPLPAVTSLLPTPLFISITPAIMTEERTERGSTLAHPSVWKKELVHLHRVVVSFRRETAGGAASEFV